MTDQLQKYNQATLPDTLNATSLQGLADGLSPCNSLDGLQTNLFGQDRALASHSVAQGSKKASQTNDTSGQFGLGSSASVALTSCLVNKLKARFATAGSMEFNETWKEKSTPSGIAYWAHIASARRTSVSDCSGWPTPPPWGRVERRAWRIGSPEGAA